MTLADLLVKCTRAGMRPNKFVRDSEGGLAVYFIAEKRAPSDPIRFASITVFDDGSLLLLKSDRAPGNQPECRVVHWDAVDAALGEIALFTETQTVKP